MHTQLNNSFRNQYPNQAEFLGSPVDKNNISYIDEDTGDVKGMKNSVLIPGEPKAMDRKESVPKLSARTRTSQGTFKKHRASFVS